MTWNLTDAKNRLSELLKLVHTEGPQKITRHNKAAVVVISEAEYDRLRGATPGFKSLLLSGPSLEGINLKRDRSGMRDVSL
jgi:prevent-host-death family protein